MKPETKEIIRLTSYEILKTLVVGGALVFQPFAKYDYQRKEVREILDEYPVDWGNLVQKISYLKRHGVIREFYEGKKKYIEITPRGIDKLEKLGLNNLKVPRPKIWDKRWRIVIFDIPEKDRELRNIIRHRLYNLGFQQIQKSVFVYPFECTKEVNAICGQWGGRQYLKYMIAEIIEGEDSIIEQFMDSGVLVPEDLA